MALGIDFLKDVDACKVAIRGQVGSKIVQKIDLGEVLGGSKRPRPKNEVRYPFFGVLFGRSWRPLGAVLGLLGPSGAVFGRLGASWGRLGPFKIRCQNRSKNRYLSRSIFDPMLVDFGKKMEASRKQNLSKSDHELTSYQKCRTGLQYCEN